MMIKQKDRCQELTLCTVRFFNFTLELDDYSVKPKATLKHLGLVLDADLCNSHVVLQ